MDGVVRAVMVAGHTVGTVAVPKRTKTLFYTLLRIGIVASHRYVAQRTDLSAQAARDATVVYRKLLVGNQQAIEQCIGNVGVEARHLATDHINNLLALLDTLCHHRQTLTDGIDFATLILRSVKTESREVDIRLGHHKREGGIKVKTFCFQRFSEPFRRAPNIVATGAGKVAIGGFGIDCQPTYIVRHHAGHRPSIYRTHHSKRLIRPKSNRRL